jgi:uncharacterized protein (TIGR02145 family)
VYSENQTKTTDGLGQVSTVVGQGTALTGTFAAINWGTGTHFLAIELNTGNGFVAMGTTQLLSVPYALYANSAGNAQTTSPDLATVLGMNNGANNLQIKNLAAPTDASDAVTKHYVDTKIPNGNHIGDNLIWNGTNWIVIATNLSAQLPQLATVPATGITPFIANSGGTITADGGFSIISKGVCWSTSPNPTINDYFSTNGLGAGSFTSVLNNLVPGTTYYYRAYATNTNGTSYGMSYTLTTTGLPTVTSIDISTLSYSAFSGGIITSNGGEAIIARGVVWSTSPSPTTALASKTTDGTGTGTFTSTLTGLASATRYYVRAYATNAAGTAYGTEVSFTTNAAAVLPSVTIGTQVWQSVNLEVTSYRDGTPIPQVTDPTAWARLTTGAWCYYNNDPAYGAIYGKLYNWYAVAGIHDNDPNTHNKILAPEGWHIPTDAEWITLSTFLGGESVAGGKMKATGTSLWRSPNTGATNSSGFTGLPAGSFDIYFSRFSNDGYGGYWWSSSENDTSSALGCYLFYNVGNASRTVANKKTGYSVRFLRGD